MPLTWDQLQNARQTVHDLIVTVLRADFGLVSSGLTTGIGGNVGKSDFYISFGLAEPDYGDEIKQHVAQAIRSVLPGSTPKVIFKGQKFADVDPVEPGRYMTAREMHDHINTHGGRLFVNDLHEAFNALAGMRPTACGFAPANGDTMESVYVRFGVETDQLDAARAAFNDRAEGHPINALLPEGVIARVEVVKPIYMPGFRHLALTEG